MVTISQLPPQTEAELRKLVESGEYGDATEIVVQAVHQFARREQDLVELRAKLQVGLDELARGEWVEFTPDFRRNLRADAHQLAISGEPLDPDVCG